MLEISRWTEAGGSYRTIQRLYHTPLLWLQIQWGFFVSQLQKPNDEYIAAGDEVVFGKAGKETYGIGRFFSSLQNRVIPGLSFFVFSVIHVKERHSYPIQAVQMASVGLSLSKGRKKQTRRRSRKKQSKQKSVLWVARNRVQFPGYQAVLGLEQFHEVKQEAVINVANLSFFTVNPVPFFCGVIEKTILTLVFWI